MKTNILQETIRRILKEENNLLLMIRRRVPHDVLEREFIESLDKSSEMLVSMFYNGQYLRRIESFEHIAISMMMDGIHHELHSTTPENLDSKSSTITAASNLELNTMSEIS
jgi:hypothetical protein